MEWWRQHSTSSSGGSSSSSDVRGGRVSEDSGVIPGGAGSAVDLGEDDAFAQEELIDASVEGRREKSPTLGVCW